ncbi:glycosyltransferase family 4 protein [Terrimonas sp. NA20]|uniref:Glycosyltransferase family 4 protein n=1 Tax=Terrimonas ginsenosidimutans TaxID=2908004 RepID=A0ABS9KNS8_9BACT|nr:glycosyltransferase family 4 protein [Terrimonas ginsenosidimutans]MCG2613986.1 glycosyltransferase family 4 protein [Terrimonas ginsenosidimutans]
MAKLIRTTTAPLSLKYLLRNQMKYMKDSGFDVVMVSSEGREKNDVINNEQCRYETIPMTRKMTPLADLKSLWLFYRFLKKEKPEIVHSHTPKAGLIAMLAAKLAGVPVRIHTVAGLRFMTAQGFTRKLLVFMEKLTMSSATHVWPNSFSLKDYIQNNKLVRSSKLEVIGEGSSNGIDLRRFSAAALKEEELEKTKKLIGYDTDFFYLLSVGRIVRDKGIDELVHAFEEVYRTNDQLRLILVGAFEDELDPISDAARRLITDHPGIIQAGWNEQVEYFMHISHLLIHPSHREGFPNVLLQAGAMNCPIICSRIEGNIDIVTHEETGLIFDVKDQQQLARLMKRAVESPQQMKEYADRLYNKVNDHYDQRVVHSRIEKRYRELLNK